MTSPAPQKTNAARILEKLGIAFELRGYEVDESDLSAESVAAKVGLPAEQVFKTLVVRGDRHGIAMAVIPGDQELDRKALAKSRATKRSTPSRSKSFSRSPATFAAASRRWVRKKTTRWCSTRRRFSST